MNVLLVLVGSALVKITLDGTYLRYVKPASAPLVLMAGIVIIALALAAIARPARHHHHPGARWCWLLVLPVLTIFLVAPPALGADTVLRDGRATRIAPPGEAFAPLPRGIVPMAVSEFVARSVWDPTHALNTRTVALTGFIVHTAGSDYVARLVITCCAADATPMTVALTGHLASDLANNQWITVTGRLRPGSATTANGYTPTLLVTELHTVGPPADPYEH
ncbi:MAG TPA: TIGR03943 family protein [Pseudonocardiaceae bacterium]